MKRGRLFLAGLVGTAMGGGLAGLLSCSAKHEPSPGAILLSIDTNLKVPADIDQVGISVAAAGDGGTVSFDNIYDLRSGEAVFPATLAVVHGTDEPVDIRAVGYSQGVAVSMHETVTTLPTDRTVLLRLALNWLDKGTVTGTNNDSVHALASTCPSGQTSVGGACKDFHLDSLMLPLLDAKNALPSSDSDASVSVDTCFSEGFSDLAAPPPVAGGACTVPVPAGGTSQNLGLKLAVTANGWCFGPGAVGGGADGVCIIPLLSKDMSDIDRDEGWYVNAAGQIQLPDGVCNGGKVQGLRLVPTSPACPQMGSSNPVRQSYSGDGGPVFTAPADAGIADATVPDAGPVDAGPPFAAFSSGASHYIAALALSATRAFYVDQATNGQATPVPVGQATLFSLPLTFGSSPAPTPTNLASFTAGSSLTTYATAAVSSGTKSHFAIALNAQNVWSVQVYAIDDTAGTATSEGVVNLPSSDPGMIENVGLYISSTGATRVVVAVGGGGADYSGLYAATAPGNGQQVQATTVTGTGLVSSFFAFDPSTVDTSDPSVALLSSSGSSPQQVFYGPVESLTPSSPYASIPSTVTTIGYGGITAVPGFVIYGSYQAQLLSAATSLASDASATPLGFTQGVGLGKFGEMGAAGNRLFWHSDSMPEIWQGVVGATGQAAGDASVVPLNTTGDAGPPQLLTVANGQLFWAYPSAATLRRQNVALLPTPP